MISGIDYFPGTSDLPKTRSGIFLPPKPDPRAWIKVEQEPAMMLYETPEVFMDRWVDFIKSERDFVVFHDFAYGTPIFFFRNAIGHLAFVSITFPTSQQGRTVPGSIYAQQCPCAKWGGACPPPADE
jgi:hypothetical protein